MTFGEYWTRKIPDYYDYMYLDGYTPEQIMYALHRQMMREYEERKANDVVDIRIKSEVKIK